jgi:hypothetical protein
MIRPFLASETLADQPWLQGGDSRITAGHLAVLAERAPARGHPAGQTRSALRASRVRSARRRQPADVAATLGLALSRLADEAPAAAGLARLLAFLAPEPVPLTLLWPVSRPQAC